LTRRTGSGVQVPRGSGGPHRQSGAGCRREGLSRLEKPWSEQRVGYAGGWTFSYTHDAGEEGVEDTIRISDARMRGAAYGTIVLHVARDTLPAVLLRSCATAIAFVSAFKIVHWNSWYHSRNLNGDRRNSRHPANPCRRADMRDFIASKSFKLTKVAISNS
jgi:hypothetical protein